MMTHERFNDRLAVIGWPAREVARRLDLPENRVRRWCAGRYPVPEDVGQWIDQIADAVETTPIPTVPKR
jgi:hypothetical protein